MKQPMVGVTLMLLMFMLAVSTLMMRIHFLESHIAILDEQQNRVLAILETHNKTFSSTTTAIESLTERVERQDKTNEDFLAIMGSHTRSLQIVADNEKHLSENVWTGISATIQAPQRDPSGK